MSPPLITLRTISKTYGDAKAVDGISLTVREGEMVALIGASGSGKSTLLRAISGLIPIDADDGRIEAFGEVAQSNGRLGRAIATVRGRIGFIFQQFNLVGRLTLSTNVLLGSLGRVGFWRGLFGRWPAEARAAARAALERVGVGDYAARRASTLSGGQQQRGAIARALLQGARVILADEPVASLDPVSARRVMDILKDLNAADGITVLVTLHQVDYALRYCHRAVALKGGRVVYDGTTTGLDTATLTDIYGPEYHAALWEPL